MLKNSLVSYVGWSRRNYEYVDLCPGSHIVQTREIRRWPQRATQQRPNSVTRFTAAAALAAAISLLLLYAFVRGVYVVFFHPLAKVPGPKLYSFTTIPYYYYLAIGEWPRKLRKLHEQYGPVVRYTSGDVSFTTPDAWKKIYGHKTAHESSFHKDIRLYRTPVSGSPNIIRANDADHRRMRRLLAHAFSEKALRGQEDIMKHYIDLFISNLNEKAQNNEVVDIVRWFNYTTFDLIGDLAFGEPFHCLDTGDYHPWVAMIFQSVKLSSLAHIVKRAPWLEPVSALLTPKHMKQDNSNHHQLSRGTAKKRLQSGNTVREDFMSYILRHNDEKGMTEDEIIENSSVLIVAGSETTATQLSGTTYNLLTNRDVYDKLVREVRTSFRSEDEITLLSVNDLEYMLAVLNESFRLYPPVPIGLPRLTPKGGEYIEGYWMPEDTVVSVPQFSAYRSPRLWNDPDKFVPERWLGDKRYATDCRDILQPFSVGPRNCIGKNLAYAEMRLILARLLYNFDLEIMPDSRNWSQQKIYTLWEKGPLNVKLTPVRKETEKTSEFTQAS
ncbi:Cytochrome P450 [Niveomyces insectorum RCEF 264]|uniref:Cytochrome P450 n=1 Tax=Niveomyces insectorum RCEF 264 TaxID=1081102 RepID=A0A167SKL6_9HYPO|nr:Cytochrome P450 [Niveomyces insectorum RCEF 264]